MLAFMFAFTPPPPPPPSHVLIFRMMQVLSDVEAHKRTVGETSEVKDQEHARKVEALNKKVRDLEGELRASREVTSEDDEGGNVFLWDSLLGNLLLSSSLPRSISCLFLVFLSFSLASFLSIF